MAPRSPIVAIAALVVASACSGNGAPIDEANILEETTTTTLAPTDTAAAPRKERPRTCDALEEAAARVGIAAQLIVQLRTVDQYNLIKQGAVSLDTAQMLADLDDLRALQRTPVPEDLGTVRDALDSFAAATRLARDNMGVDDPFAEGGRGPELVALTQDVPAFLRGHVALGVALDDLGCS